MFVATAGSMTLAIDTPGGSLLCFLVLGLLRWSAGKEGQGERGPAGLGC